MQGYPVSQALVGTGVAMDVELGFSPSYLKLVNANAAAGEAVSIEWFEGMDADGTMSMNTDLEGDVTFPTSATVIIEAEGSDIQITDPVQNLGRNIVTIPAGFQDASDVMYLLAFP